MDIATWNYISNQSGQKILEWKTCKYTWEQFPIFEKEAEIIEKVSPIFIWEKYTFPLPSISPKIRAFQKMLWRNERNMYKRKCDITGKEIVSVYHPEYSGNVYSFQKYISDDWDPMSYGKKVDFSKSIFENFIDFFQNIPKKSIHVWPTMENSSFCNYGAHTKNCYMCQCPALSENSLYSFTPLSSNYSVDSHISKYCEITYECIDCTKGYKIFFCQDVEETKNSYFCRDCKNCENCIGCIGLQWKKNCIFNTEVSQQEFEQKRREIFQNYESVENFKWEFQKFAEKFPQKWTKVIAWENCFGDGIFYSKDIINGYDCIQLQDSFHCLVAGVESNNLLDCISVGLNTHYVYQSVGCSDANQSAFQVYGGGNNGYYLFDVRWSSNLLFCTGLTNKEYCIFNTQYTKEEYEKLAPKIIEHMMQPHPNPLLKGEGEIEWWEFFPSELSPFPYNDSIAIDYYPVKEIVYLDKQKEKEVYNQNGTGTLYVLEPQKSLSKAIIDFWWQEKIHTTWRTHDIGSKNIQGNTTLTSEDIPEIDDVTDDILEKIIICEETKRPFKLVKEELDFYRKYHLPIPRKHPEVRYQKRFAKKAKNELYLEKCVDCGCETLSIFGDKKVLCEKCYNKKIY